MSAAIKIRRRSPWRQTLYNALDTARRQGVKGVWFKTLSATGVYRRVVLLRLSLVNPLEPITAGFPIATATLSESDIPRIVAMGNEISAQDIRKRFVRGDVCLGALYKEKLVGHVWACTAEPYSTYMCCHIPRGENEIYLYDAYTIEAMRGKKISPLLSVELMRQFRDAGYTWAIRSTVPENIAALSSHEKLGFRRQGITGVIALGPWRRTFHRSIG